MRINELLVFPDAEIILESYRDFARLWDEMLSNGKLNSSHRIKEIPSTLEGILRSNRHRAILDSGEEYHLYSTIQKIGVKNPLDASSWVAALRDMKRESGSYVAINKFSEIIRWVDEELQSAISERDPDYSVVVKNQEYIIFKVNNYSAAKKLRNKIKSTWCIGANRMMFNLYGKDEGRETFIVFFLRANRGMVFHLDSRGNGLITSHDNNRDWNIRNGTISPNRGYTELNSEISKYLDEKTFYKLMSEFRLKF